MIFKMIWEKIKKIRYIRNIFFVYYQIKLNVRRISPSKSGKEIQRKVLEYCNSLKGNGSGYYKYSDGCPETALASAFAALTLNLIGELEKLQKKEKKLWIRYLQGFQDKKTGLFLKPIFKEEDKKSLAHSNELLFAHFSTFTHSPL